MKGTRHGVRDVVALCLVAGALSGVIYRLHTLLLRVPSSAQSHLGLSVRHVPQYYDIHAGRPKISHSSLFTSCVFFVSEIDVIPY